MPRMADAGDSDEALMLRYVRGDAQAFDLLYRRHEMKIWRYIYRSVCDQAIADEVMQEVWFAVVRAARRYQPTARFTTWLFTLAHHELVDRHRRSKNWRPAADVDDLIADAIHDPVRQAQSRQHGDALIAAIEQLPIEQRDAFLLHAEGDLTVEEIAKITGTAYETVKSRLRYARGKLKQLLQEHA
jgi:RNA polymerase sigma-70 factor (ECF subfamily)